MFARFTKQGRKDRALARSQKDWAWKDIYKNLSIKQTFTDAALNSDETIAKLQVALDQSRLGKVALDIRFKRPGPQSIAHSLKRLFDGAILAENFYLRKNEVTESPHFKNFIENLKDNGINVNETIYAHNSSFSSMMAEILPIRGCNYTPAWVTLTISKENRTQKQQNNQHQMVLEKVKWEDNGPEDHGLKLEQ